MTHSEYEFALGYKEGFNDGYKAGKELSRRELAKEIAEYLGAILAPYNISIVVDPDW